MTKEFTLWNCRFLEGSSCFLTFPQMAALRETVRQIVKQHLGHHSKKWNGSGILELLAKRCDSKMNSIIETSWLIAKKFFRFFTIELAHNRNGNWIQSKDALSQTAVISKITSLLQFGVGFVQLINKSLLLLMMASKSTIKLTAKTFWRAFCFLGSKNSF